MWLVRGTIFAVMIVVAFASRAHAADAPASPADPLARWRKDVKIHPLIDEDVHSIHAYYVFNPESPDGTKVLYYVSTVPSGEQGEIRIFERKTGKSTVIAKDIITEDAHRAACQQWVAGGKKVAFHTARASGEWEVVVVDVESGKAT